VIITRLVDDFAEAGMELENTLLRFNGGNQNKVLFEYTGLQSWIENGSDQVRLISVSKDKMHSQRSGRQVDLITLDMVRVQHGSSLYGPKSQKQSNHLISYQ
jgi:hypothetical protein